MKNRYFSILVFLISVVSIAQQGINYKAVVKDNSGNVVANQNITVQFTILKGTAQSNVYQETHTPTTDANGLIIVNIGEGTVGSGDFPTIDWSSDDHFFNVQIDTGSGLTDLGTTQFMAVPYAKFAEDTKKGTLNDAYNKGGDGAGRTIDAIHGKVEITGNGLEIKNNSTFTQPQLALVEDNASYARLKFKNTNRNGDDFWDIAGYIGDEAANDKLNIYNSDGGNILTATGDGRVGVGTTNPNGSLDVVSVNDTGMVIPRVSSVENVTDGQGNPPVNGTIVYDISTKSICFYLDGKWACGAFNSSQTGVSFDDADIPYQTTQLYFKSDAPNIEDDFGYSIALSDDGNTLAIGAPLADYVSGNYTHTDCGFVILYRKINNVWSYLKTRKAFPSSGEERRSFMEFGTSVSLNADGSVLAVGSHNFRYRSSSPIFYGVGLPTFGAANQTGGAVFVYRDADDNAYSYIRSNNVDANDSFGFSLSLDNSGNRLVVGAYKEDSNATGVNGDGSDNSKSNSGAVYVFESAGTGTPYVETAYIKASNPDASDFFGRSVAISGDGQYIVVGSQGEKSASTGVNGDQTNNTVIGAGASYVFYKNNNSWEQQAYIKSSILTSSSATFGYVVSIDDTGSRVAISAINETGTPLGNNGDTNTTTFNPGPGSVYLVKRTGSSWSPEAYLRASHPASLFYGSSLALSGDGNTLLVGAYAERSNATGVNPLLNNGEVANSGASFSYNFINGTWQFTALIKATKAINADDNFGAAAALNTDGSSIVLSANKEDGAIPYMGGDQNDNNMQDSGAVYLYEN